MIGLPNPYVLLGVALAAVAIAAGSYVKGHNDGYQSLKADWDDQQVRQQAEYAERWRLQAEDLKALAAEKQKEQVTYEQNLRAVSVQRDALLASVRNRPERAAVPASGAAAEACTGATGRELSRPDAEFLARLAGRADDLREALRRCQGGDVAEEGGRGDR